MVQAHRVTALDGSGPWGFTLMRKRPGGGMPIAEYFVLPDGKIPTFKEDALYPFMKGDRKRYRRAPEAGTVIKLYDYLIGVPVLWPGSGVRARR